MLMVIFLAGCPSETPPVESPRPVSVSMVESFDSMESKSFSGIVQERDLVRLSFRVAGQVEEIPVEEGCSVREGELLARLDSRDYRLQLEATRAEYERVIAEVKRYKELYTRKNITEIEYEKALAGEKQINAKLAAAENALNDTRLLSPFDGYVQAVYVSEKEMVDAGTLILSLVDLSVLVIETNIPPAFYILRDRFEDFSFSSSLFPGEDLPLELIGITAKADMGNLYRARFRYRPDPGCLLAPGMSVRVTMRYRPDSPVHMRVPLSAVVEEAGERFLWFYRDGRVMKQKVETAMVDSHGMVGIKKGLSPGDMVVTAGNHGLADGEIVKTVR